MTERKSLGDVLAPITNFLINIDGVLYCYGGKSMISKELLMDLSDQMEAAQDAIIRYYDNECPEFGEAQLLEVLSKVDLGVWSVMQEVDSE